MSNMNEEQLQLSRNELKVQALLEKISAMENQVADLRVELTLISAERDQLKELLAKNEVPQEASNATD